MDARISVGFVLLLHVTLASKVLVVLAEGAVRLPGGRGRQVVMAPQINCVEPKKKKRKKKRKGKPKTDRKKRMREKRGKQEIKKKNRLSTKRRGSENTKGRGKNNRFPHQKEGAKRRGQPTSVLASQRGREVGAGRPAVGEQRVGCQHGPVVGHRLDHRRAAGTSSLHDNEDHDDDDDHGKCGGWNERVQQPVEARA